MEIQLNTQIKSEQGKSLGKAIDCMVMDHEGNWVTNDKNEIAIIKKTDLKLDRTLKDVIKYNLLLGKPDGSDKDKIKCYDLLEEIIEADDKIEWESEEITFIKQIITSRENIWIMGQCNKLLEGKEQIINIEKTTDKGKKGTKAKND